MRLFLSLLFLIGLAQPPAQAQTAPLAPMTAGQVTVSGLSGGGYMAVQFQVAYAASIEGAGIVAAGPYFCARGNVYTATTLCSCTSDYFGCRARPDGTRVRELIAMTDWFAALRLIDPTSALARHRVWIMSGSADTVIPTPIVDDLHAFYRHYIDASRIAYKTDLPAQHGMPTDNYGGECASLGSPFINNCGFDAAGALLQWLYGPLAPRNTGAPAGRLVTFDQSEFLPVPRSHGMAQTGLLYLPRSCDGGGDGDGDGSQGCRLHVVFHGCLQNPENIGITFVEHAGYNTWADSNRIIVLYPQTAAIPPFTNPNACWDWFAYDDPRYAQKSGRQLAAVKRMVDRLTGRSNTAEADVLHDQELVDAVVRTLAP